VVEDDVGDDRAEETTSAVPPLQKFERSEHRQLDGLVRRARSRRVDRARSRAQVLAPFIRAPLQALDRPRGAA
jgi:hypothetical protein